jgi:hypothetical protein
MPRYTFTPTDGPASLDTGQDRGDDMVAEGEQRRYGPGGRAGQIVARVRAGLLTSCLPRSLPRSQECKLTNDGGTATKLSGLSDCETSLCV